MPFACNPVGPDGQFVSDDFKAFYTQKIVELVQRYPVRGASVSVSTGPAAPPAARIWARCGLGPTYSPALMADHLTSDEAGPPLWSSGS